MRAFLIICLFVASAQASTVEEYFKFKDAVKICKEKVGEDVNVLAAEVCSDWPMDRDDMEFVNCYCLTTGQMDENGNMSRDVFKSVLKCNEPIDEIMEYVQRLDEESQDMTPKGKAFYFAQSMAHFRKCR